jgi:hypothetical protein
MDFLEAVQASLQICENEVQNNLSMSNIATAICIVGNKDGDNPNEEYEIQLHYISKKNHKLWLGEETVVMRYEIDRLIADKTLRQRLKFEYKREDESVPNP